MQVIENIAKYWPQQTKEPILRSLELLLRCAHKARHGSDQVADGLWAFMLYELFLYLASVLLKYERFDLLSGILHSTYLIPNTYERLRQSNFCDFNEYVRLFEEDRSRDVGGMRLSVTADVVRGRSAHTPVSFEALCETDMLLFLVSVLQLQKPTGYWVPRLGVFRTRREGIELFDRCISSCHFNAFKPVLDVESLDDLRARKQEAENMRQP